MNCDKYLNLINDLVEGELDLQTAEQLSLHIFSCKSCESEFEILNNEKEMYSHFLFEIEPPKDLPIKFQEKLEDESQKKKLSAVLAFSFNDWFAGLFLKPVLVAVITLIVFGFGYFWLNISTQNNEKIIVSQPPIPKDSPSVNLPKKDFIEKESIVVSPEIAKLKTIPKQKVKDKIEQVSFIKPKAIETKTNIVLANSASAKKPLIRENKRQNIVETPKLDTAEEAKFREIQAFESETATQMEKIEMLLRSFRNIRYTEGSEEYDVAYEKQQAGKLLKKNNELRQKSENYGLMFTNEMLNKVEPYLLEISNLDNNPTEEEVLEIKQRVKNQNIIVSLQSF
jgi:hypothetical protein